MFRLIAILLCLTSCAVWAAPQQSTRFKAVAFDYFVIFNPNSVVPAVEKVYPGRGMEFTKAWRAKQFEYGFLRSITQQHADFFKVTEDALVYTAEAMRLPLSAADKEALMNAYLSLTPWPDAVAGLQKLKERGIKIITIANFSPKMLRDNADNAGITQYFDELLSTQANATYKPDSRAYDLGLQRLGLKKEEVVFAAFGGWDAYGAKSFGYPTYWVNRFNLPVERLDVKADATSGDMTGLLEFVLR